MIDIFILLFEECYNIVERAKYDIGVQYFN
jgi:hypothetical protein